MENIRTNHGTINNNVDYHTAIFIHPGAFGSELAGWKEKLVAILQQVPDSAEIIKPVIQFLVASIAPAKIYMMKQGAGADNERENTIDLLIVMPGKSGIAFTELEPILQIACSQYQQVRCSLHNEGTVVDALRDGHVFYSLHCIAANLVYDDKSLTYPETSPAALAAIKQQARQNFDSYFQKALEFYSIALTMHQSNCSTLVTFMLHQAIELTYRGILQSLNGYDKKTHDIRILMKLALRCARQINTVFEPGIEENNNLIELLNHAYLAARYEPDYIFDEKYLLLAFEKVGLLHTTAKKIIETKLNA